MVFTGANHLKPAAEGAGTEQIETPSLGPKTNHKHSTIEVVFEGFVWSPAAGPMGAEWAPNGPRPLGLGHLGPPGSPLGPLGSWTRGGCRGLVGHSP